VGHSFTTSPGGYFCGLSHAMCLILLRFYRLPQFHSPKMAFVHSPGRNRGWRRTLAGRRYMCGRLARDRANSGEGPARRRIRTCRSLLPNCGPGGRHISHGFCGNRAVRRLSIKYAPRGGNFMQASCEPWGVAAEFGGRDAWMPAGLGFVASPLKETTIQGWCIQAALN